MLSGGKLGGITIALIFAPLAAHRGVEHLTLRWQGDPVSQVALHTLPPLAMLLLALALWRRIRPLPGRRGVAGQSLALAGGLLLGTLAAVANLMAILARDELVPNTAAIDAGATALVFHVTVLAPVAEEAAFRGLIFRHLRQTMTPLLAALVAAAIFALMHGSWQQASWAFGLGLVTAFAYEQTGALLAPILVHALFNAVPVGVAMARTQPDDVGPIWLVLTVVALIFTYAAREAGRAAGRAAEGPRIAAG